MKEVLEQIKSVTDQAARENSCYLYDAELIGSGANRTLRIYIDKDAEKGANNGISIEDCSKISRSLNAFLDENDIIPGGQYTLEVSSPGLERTLKEKWHFEKVIGKEIMLKCFNPLLQFNESVPALAKAKQIKGELTQVLDESLKMKVELAGQTQEIVVPFKEITKANLVFVFDQAHNKQ